MAACVSLLRIDKKMKTKFTCKECKMEFSEEERLKRHFVKAHPKKRKIVDPSEYWHDPGAGG